MAIRAGVLTISDKASRGERVDTSGAAIAELLTTIDATIDRSEVVPDEQDQIAATLRSWADSDELDLVVTTGGTGLGPRDVTPEAMTDVIERPVPGLGELMRSAGLKHTPMAAPGRTSSATRLARRGRNGRTHAPRMSSSPGCSQPIMLCSPQES